MEMPKSEGVTNAHLIGNVITTAAYFENILFFLVTVILKTDQTRAHIICASIPSVYDRMEFIRVLANTFCSDERAKEIFDIFEEISPSIALRNSIAHGSIVNCGADGQYLSQKKKTGKKTSLTLTDRTRKISRAELIDAQNAFMSNAYKLGELSNALAGEVQTKAKASS